MANISIREATRADIHDITLISNAANASSHHHRLIAPSQDTHPWDYHLWRLNIVRARFATPSVRTIVAVDTSTDEVLGLASYAAEGPSALLDKWTQEKDSWTNWVERQLLGLEARYRALCQYTSINASFLSTFLNSFLTNPPPKPPLLHAHIIAVHPCAQGHGIGRHLLRWGQDLAQRENLPLYLESTLEAVGFYEKGRFKRLSGDCVIDVEGGEGVRLPVFVWEAEGREGDWVERDGEGGRWRWRDEVLVC